MIRSTDEPRLAALIVLVNQWQATIIGDGALLTQINCSLDGTLVESVTLSWNATNSSWDITT